MIDRRELIQRTAAILGGALSSGTVLGVLGGCAATPRASAHGTKFFTPGEAATVAVISEHIMPRTDTPGAIDVGVPAFIDRMMADFYQDKERNALRAGLSRVDPDAKAAHGATFVALTGDQQIELLKRYDREAYEQAHHAGATPSASPHFFRTLKELTTVGFFTSEAGASKFLKYEAVPGPYRGDIPYSQVGREWAV